MNATCVNASASNVSMLTYDALSFTQVAFIFYILVGISAVLLRLRTVRERATVPATTAVQPSAAPAGGLGFALIGAALLLFDFTHGPNMKVFIAVLIMLALGTWSIERGGAARRLAA